MIKKKHIERICKCLDILYKNKQVSKKNKKDILGRITKRIKPFKELIENVKEL